MTALHTVPPVPSCLGTPMEMWEPGDPLLEHFGKQLCAACPMLIDCRTEAVAQGDVDTIRGGMNPHERHRWARRQGMHTVDPDRFLVSEPCHRNVAKAVA